MCMAVFVFVGCHKKAAAPPSDQIATTTEAPATTQEQAPSAPQSTPVPVVQPAKALPPPPPSVAARAENNLRQNVTGEVNAFLSTELRNFVQLKHRMPDSFSEFASVRLDSIPRPPDGKKWVIDIEALQVKAVPAK